MKSKAQETIKISTKAKNPAPKGGKLDFPFRSDKLIKLIDAKLGSSSSEVHRYDINLLEKQALRFLKLEDNEAKEKQCKPTTQGNFFPVIIGACCYIQTKQAQKWEIPMKEFTRICKVLGIKKCSQAISFCEKWANETSKNEQKDASIPMEDNESGVDLITYDSRPREDSPKLSQGRQLFIEHDEAYKQRWYDQNSTYLLQVLNKGVNDLVNDIDCMLHGDGVFDPADLDAQILQFNQRMMTCSEMRFFSDNVLAHNQKYKEMQTNSNEFYPCLQEFRQWLLDL